MLAMNAGLASALQIAERLSTPRASFYEVVWLRTPEGRGRVPCCRVVPSAVRGRSYMKFGLFRPKGTFRNKEVLVRRVSSEFIPTALGAHFYMAWVERKANQRKIQTNTLRAMINSSFGNCHNT